MSTHTLSIAFAASLLLLGCGDEASKPSGSSSAAPASSAAAAAELPTPADFEEEAEKEITAENAEAKLAELEKEIGASP